MGAPPIDAEAATSTAVPPRFVPVMLPAPLAAPVTTPEPTRPTIIEIVLDGRRTVRVGAEVDTGALIRIIDALEKRR